MPHLVGGVFGDQDLFELAAVGEGDGTADLRVDRELLKSGEVILGALFGAEDHAAAPIFLGELEILPVVRGGELVPGAQFQLAVFEFDPSSDEVVIGGRQLRSGAAAEHDLAVFVDRVQRLLEDD